MRAVDSGGNPLAGAKVRVEMKRHAFAFGSAVTAQMLAVETSDGYKYRWIVENYFNKVVFENDLKWPPWETAKSNTHGSYRRQWIDAAFAWLAERGIKVRGHYVSWAPLDSADGHGNGPLETLRERLFAHMEDKLPAVGDRALEWDAVNHIAGWGETLETRYGADIYAEIIRRARRLAPGAGLWVNEGQILPSGSRRNEYERLIRYLVEHDSAPDGIGMMGHFEEASLTGLPEVYKVMNRFAGLVPRLQLTELDVNTADERLHADYLRDIMTMAFSHPAFTGIVMWGFWEGRHWRPDAALWRRDWSIKPAGEVWLDLVFNQWWTDTELTADEAGLAQTRGFLGDYRITVTWQGQSRTIEASLDSRGLAMDVTL